MNKIAHTFDGNYTDSIRTSGEVVSDFILDKEVICKPVSIIDANLQILY